MKNPCIEGWEKHFGDGKTRGITIRGNAPFSGPDGIIYHFGDPHGSRTYNKHGQQKFYQTALDAFAIAWNQQITNNGGITPGQPLAAFTFRWDDEDVTGTKWD